jgi:hypothetical protein
MTQRPPRSGRGNVSAAPPKSSVLRYPLAIVLDHRTWRRWQQFKQQVGRKRDREAFAILLERAAAEGLFPLDDEVAS